MSVTVHRSAGRLADIPLTNRDLMREVGLLARERILRRTAAGKDVSGAAFASYSPGYAKQKTEAVGHAGTVTLQLSGQMLQGITIVELTDTRVELGFR
jgi:hypothetical protein